MTTPVKLGVIGVLSLFSAMVMGGLNGATTYAMNATEQTEETLTTQSPDNITIEPICADATSSMASWKVVNRNTDSATISWNNMKNALTGSYTAPTGESVMKTGYVASDPNNTTDFTYLGKTTSTNSSVTPCQPVVHIPAPVECVDGNDQSNLSVSFVDNNTAMVSTKDGKLLCDDVSVFFSSYIMPDNYNGQGFYNNPTATPQYVFSSDSATLEAGTTGETLLSIDLPDRCKNVQTDVYYGPDEITYVGPEGHGTRNILSNVIQKADDCDQTCEHPGDNGNGNTGGTPTTPSQPTTTTPVNGNGATGVVEAAAVTAPAVVPQQPAAPVLPAELPETGPSSTPPYAMLGLLLALMTYAVVYRYNGHNS